MRNLFDQYNHPENRLSHSLAVCLNEDRTLLNQFIRWVHLSHSIRERRLHVIEQSLPGEEVASEEEAERRGLPDIIIHDDDSWCLLIESKIQAPLTQDQLCSMKPLLQRILG